MVYHAQDDSDSDDDEGSTAGGSSRRFFPKKRRHLSNDTAISASFNDRQHHAEGRLRRMSHAMSRRPRANTSSSADGGSGPISAAPSAHRGSGALSPAGMQVTRRNRSRIGDTGGEAAGGAGAATSADGGGDGQTAEEDDDEDSDKDELPPPFTMALAVMLTGLRLFLVDQARLSKRS